MLNQRAPASSSISSPHLTFAVPPHLPFTPPRSLRKPDKPPSDIDVLATIIKVLCATLLCALLYYGTSVPPFQPSIKAPSSPLFPPPVSSSPLLVTTMVLSLDEVTPKMWKSLNQLCQLHPQTHLAILYKLQGASASNPSISSLSSACANLLLIPQTIVESSSAYKALLPSLSTRVRKLGFLRAWLREHLAASPTIPISSLAAVLVIDLDILTFPDPWSLAKAIATVEQSSKGGRGGTEVVCANGYEQWLGMRHYYDSFALVLKNGDFGFYTLSRFSGLIALLQNKLYNDLVSTSHFPVQSCFGGFAVYNPAAFFTETCNYHTHHISEKMLPGLLPVLERYADPNGDTCEHVVFHLCLHYLNAREFDFDIGIQGDLLVFRDANIFGGINNPTFVYLLFIAACAWVVVRAGGGLGLVGGGGKGEMMKAKQSNADFSPYLV